MGKYTNNTEGKGKSKSMFSNVCSGSKNTTIQKRLGGSLITYPGLLLVVEARKSPTQKVGKSPNPFQRLSAVKAVTPPTIKTSESPTTMSRVFCGSDQ